MNIQRSMRLSVLRATRGMQIKPTFMARSFTQATDSTEEKGEGKKWKLVYEGQFSGMLRRLRRVSITSSILSTFGFPLTYIFGIPSATISAAGQVGIVGTVLVSSLSSTLFLHLVTHTYVTKLHELVPKEGVADTADNDDKDRQFKANRLNLFGNEIENEFNLSEVTKPSSSKHPYASCCAKETYMYMHGKEHMKDESLRRPLTMN